MNRKEYLETAQKIICENRQDVHGSPEDCFRIIANYWTTFLTKQSGHLVAIAPEDVSMMMVLFKLARWQMNGQHADNIIDLLGYGAIAGELNDMDTMK